MLLMLALFGASCGYHPVARDRFFGRQRITVATFVEHEPVGVAPDLARYLAELAAQGGVAVVATDAEARLVGVVRGVRTSALPIADPRPGAPITGYQVSIDVDARLVASDGVALWSTSVSASEDFVPTPSSAETSPVAILETEASRRRALDRLAQRAAREIYERLVMSGG